MRFTISDIFKFQVPCAVISWVWVLGVNYPVWDDWTLMFQSADALLSVPDPRMFVWAVIQMLPFPLYFYHVAVLFCTWAIAYCLGALLLEVWKLPYHLALIASVAMICIPVNPARVAVVNFPYLLSFTIYAYATLRFVRLPSLGSQLLISALWMLSFMTPSLLLFHYAIMLIVGYKLNIFKSYFYGLALLLPLVAWLIRYVFFQPEDVYATYYAIQVKDVLPAILSSVWVCMRQVYELSMYAFAPIVLGVFVMAWLPIVLVIRKIQWDIPFSAYHWLLAGFVLMLVAVYPYMLIHKEPGLWDWQSRHQLLMPPGILLLSIAILKFVSMPLRPYVAAVFLSVGISMCISFGMEWYRDSQQIRKLQKVIDTGMAGGDYHTIQIEITEPGLFAFNRKLRMYELTGMRMQDSVKQNRLLYAIPPGTPVLERHYLSDTYFLRDYVPGFGDTLKLKYP
jgi:hypothetical protein